MLIFISDLVYDKIYSSVLNKELILVIKYYAIVL